MVKKKEKIDSFGDFIMDQLAAMPALTSRAMFGGRGLYSEEVFFGIIFKGRLYFKTSEMSRGAYLELGSKPFKPNEKQTLKNYYEVPVEVFESSKELTKWAEKALKAVTL